MVAGSVQIEKPLSQHEQDLRRLEKFRLMDDDFLSAAFTDNIEATELLLQIVLERADLSVIEVSTQKEIKNPYGRSVRLDIDATDRSSKRYDIEIQREDRGSIAQ